MGPADMHFVFFKNTFIIFFFLVTFESQAHVERNMQAGELGFTANTSVIFARGTYDINLNLSWLHNETENNPFFFFFLPVVISTRYVL